MDTVVKLYNDVSVAEAIMGSDFINYHDLVSAEESKTWDDLCNKDFKTVLKIQKCRLGEGHFNDDSDSDSGNDNQAAKHMPDTSDDSDEADNILTGNRRNLVDSRRRGNVRGGTNNDDDDEDDFDHNAFMEQMMSDM